MPTAKQVLIVDDEPLIRLSAIDVAQDAGFETLAASSYDQAIALLEEGAEINVLFTDIRMAGQHDGLELANAVRQRWPHVGVIVTSGHTNEVGQGDGVCFLSKPYSPEELTRALQEVS